MTSIVAFDDPMLCFPALTPNRLVFKTDSPTAGFILDLDFPDEPTSITHCVSGRAPTRPLTAPAVALTAVMGGRTGPTRPSDHVARPQNGRVIDVNVIRASQNYGLVLGKPQKRSSRPSGRLPMTQLAEDPSSPVITRRRPGTGTPSAKEPDPDPAVKIVASEGSSTLRFAAYDRITPSIAPPPNTLYPRHALESLFNTLIWVALCKDYTSAHTYSTWFSNVGYNLPQDRTRSEYQQFVDRRRHFLVDATWYWNAARVQVGMYKLVDAWLVPLGRMIREAHFFLRGRQEEEGDRYDWETLGGKFTVDGDCPPTDAILNAALEGSTDSRSEFQDKLLQSWGAGNNKMAGELASVKV
ncbi:hypothetical protein FB45DRAFT_879356 [Roridomyces roridus]|uniref:Uncharacterized protein n=1 Tax=Roridomyces roridus TaxID=1738132 RepID=A0AAD7AZE5_9AGAR|nr:hypothetical protein FB45DRAFT_879356 [Roridomyces roridus]